MAEITVEVAKALPDNFILDKVVVLVEGIDGDDGETAVWWSASPGMKAWHTLGILSAAVEMEKDWIKDSYSTTADDDDE